MSRLLESICLLDGQFQNLEYHLRRIINSTEKVFGGPPGWSLVDFLGEQRIPSSGLFKCRILYGRQPDSVTFSTYTIRPVRTLKLIEDNQIRYPHKFEDRTFLERHFENRGGCDDVLIISHGLVTDTLASNIVFRRGEEWITPSSFLLRGTMRQNLLDQGMIREARIAVDDIDKFEQFRLINALLRWDGPVSDVSNIN